MKNLALAAGILLIGLTAAPAVAMQYVRQPVPSDLYELEHQKAYRWGINLVIPANEIIVSASLFFDNIRNWDSNPNVLYVTLIDNATAGVTIYTDNENPSNYFSSWGPSLVTYVNLPPTPQDITYNFTGPRLQDLRDFLANNNFGIGIDPDCHFYNCGITLTVETAQVPEPSTYAMMAAGLAATLGTGVLRRRLK